MHRSELHCSDTKIFFLLNKGWGIVAQELRYHEVGGSYFCFIATTENQDKYFLKIYPVNQYPDMPTEETLDKMGRTLYRLRHQYGINNIAYCIPLNDVEFSLEDSGFILTLYEYIEGFHPSYSPNELLVDKLAKTFSLLHQVPSILFPELKTESFDLSYAEGLRQWLDVEKSSNEMINALMLYHAELKNCLDNLIKMRASIVQQQFRPVITHGDAHHLNILQHNGEVWLVDWDGINIAPAERDLWHYENSPVIAAYEKLYPKFKINVELCEFYQHRRFLEDIRYYIEQVILEKATTKAQKDSDKTAFLNHWGWKLCLGK